MLNTLLVVSMFAMSVANAATITSTCGANFSSKFGVTNDSMSPCLGSFSFTDPLPGQSQEAVVAGSITNTDTSALILLGAGGGGGLFQTETMGTASYSSSTQYLIPGTGTGTIVATVFEGQIGMLTGGNTFFNGISSFSIGSQNYGCSFNACQSGGGPNMGTFLSTRPGGTQFIIDNLFTQTGTFTLGQPFTIGFSMSQRVMPNIGELETGNIEGGIISLQFYDANGNPLSPTPEPSTWFMISGGLMAIGLFKRSRKRP